MDNFDAFNRKDSFPAYTLEQLIAFVVAGNTNPKIVAEIAYREAQIAKEA